VTGVQTCALPILWYNNISIMLKVVLTRLVYDRLIYEQAQ